MGAHRCSNPIKETTTSFINNLNHPLLVPPEVAAAADEAAEEAVTAWAAAALAGMEKGV
jgi:hypothetical protein